MRSRRSCLLMRDDHKIYQNITMLLSGSKNVYALHSGTKKKRSFPQQKMLV